MGLERRRLGLAPAVLDHGALRVATGCASASTPAGAGSDRPAARRFAAALAQSVAARAATIVAVGRDFRQAIDTVGV
jgi:hypothetical protein